MCQAIAEGRLGMGLAPGPVHGLEKEVLERQVFESSGLGAILGKDQLDLVPSTQHQLGSCLGAHAHPIDACRWLQRPIGLDGNLELPGMERLKECSVQLEQGLSAGTDHKTPPRGGVRPRGRNRLGQRFRSGKAAAAGSVGPHKVGIAKRAGGVGPVALSAGSQVAPSEPAEYRRPSGVGSLALEGVVDLLDRVSHKNRKRVEKT
jgi:hypothetical protein